MGTSGMEAEMPANAVGRRVSCKGEHATVRYVGPVPPTAGLWLGVEWDNPDRGKHDGSHEGTQYFTCSHPKGGSFIHLPKASFGVDFLTAVAEVYQGLEEESMCELVEVVLFKDRSFESLLSASLRGKEVNGPGVDGKIRKTTPNITELDLSKTLMSCWEDVAAITQQMDNLEELILSDNRLRLPAEPSAHCQAFCNLKVLVLNSCDLTWRQILTCASMWPQLEDLCLNGNNLTELQRPDGVLLSLKSLSLCRNPLKQGSVTSLAYLPRLETLKLTDTGLSVIQFDDIPPESKTALFPQLTYLYLDKNNISEWFVVDELDKLPSLVQLTCRRNKLVTSDGNPKSTDKLIIAKVGQLISLNGGQILPEDRSMAELDYIKRFGEEWMKAGGHPDPQQSHPSPHFTCQHRRYQSLIDKYAPEEGELKKAKSFALKNELLKITFVFPDNADRKPIEKKLPASMVVHKVKGLLHRLLKIPVAELQLTYTSAKTLSREFEIDGDLKTLQFYAIEDGDKVLVRWA
ncbi:tubulin-specific chaperone E [Genypterus blacodes]|uniref:tubulin-specific chaperone E n=1 Tax=Genypterus blacodes TaxID=154954 RepID=UPI003F75AF39